jgi:hypothetical protein
MSVIGVEYRLKIRTNRKVKKERKREEKDVPQFNSIMIIYSIIKTPSIQLKS